MSFNKIILVGNLTRDIELRYTQSGSAIANTAIATNRKFTVNNEKREEVCFVDITFFSRSAEIANQYLRKGSKILVEGRLKFDQWTDQNGQKRSKHSVIVETMQMLDSKSDSQNSSGGQSQYQQPQQGQQQQYQQPRQQQQGQQQYQQQHQQQQGYQQQGQPQHGYQPQQQQQQDIIPEIDIDTEEIPF